MLNLAGPSYDFDHVLFAVLQECEHRRRGLLANEAERALHDAARAKLEQIHKSYVERGGTPDYWREVETEVLRTAMPQYAAEAIEQTRLERTNYDLWRHGDPLARACWGLGALAVGGLIVWLPFIPIFEDAFAFGLALTGLFYADIKRGFYQVRHARSLNRLIAGALAYQKNRLIHYMTDAELFEAIDVAGGAAEEAAPAASTAVAASAPAPAKSAQAAASASSSRAV
ncbi:MAG TPA: hypothetical protein VIH93_09875 [Thermoanaerobaculia bacterium]